MTPAEWTERLRDELVDAAREILDERSGPDEGAREARLDLRKVAERAGKSRTAPYLVFGKESEGGGLRALRVAVATSGFEELLGVLEDARHRADGPEAQLEAIAAAYLEFALAHPALFGLMYGPDVGQAVSEAGVAEPLHPEVEHLVEVRARAEDFLRDVIRACGGLHAIRTDDEVGAAVGAWALLHGMAILLLDDQIGATRLGRNPREAARTITELLLQSRPEFGEGVRAFTEAVEARSAPPSPPAPLGDVAGGARGDEAWTPAYGSAGMSAQMSAAMPPARPDVAPDSTPDMVPDAPPETPPPPALAPMRWDTPADADFDAEFEPLSVREPAGRPRPGASRDVPPLQRSNRRERGHEASVRAALSTSSALRRARKVLPVLEGARILWVDDEPSWSEAEARMLRDFGALVTPVPDTPRAIERLRTEGPFDLILSDIARPDSPTAGLQGLPLFLRAAPDTPVVFYVGEVRRDLDRPRGSFGITDQPGELLHLILDVLERKRW